MCGHFAQVQTRADYLDVLASDLEFAGALDNVPIARYNVAPGIRVLVLNQRSDKLHLDPIEWGYGLRPRLVMGNETSASYQCPS